MQQGVLLYSPFCSSFKEANWGEARLTFLVIFKF